MASVPGAKRAINRISLERQLLQIFKGGLTVDDLGPVVDTSEVERVPAGKVVLTEGEQGDDVYVIRSGSMVVEKDIGGKPIFLRYLPAGSFFGEMGVLSGRPRNATVKAAVSAELIKLTGESFRKMLAARPQVREATDAAGAERAALNDCNHTRDPK